MAQGRPAGGHPFQPIPKAHGRRRLGPETLAYPNQTGQERNPGGFRIVVPLASPHPHQPHEKRRRFPGHRAGIRRS